MSTDKHTILDKKLGEKISKEINKQGWNEDEITTFLVNFGARITSLGLSYIAADKQPQSLSSIVKVIENNCMLIRLKLANENNPNTNKTK